MNSATCCSCGRPSARFGSRAHQIGLRVVVADKLLQILRHLVEDCVVGSPSTLPQRRTPRHEQPNRRAELGVPSNVLFVLDAQLVLRQAGGRLNDGGERANERASDRPTDLGRAQCLPLLWGQHAAGMISNVAMPPSEKHNVPISPRSQHMTAPRPTTSRGVAQPSIECAFSFRCSVKDRRRFHNYVVPSSPAECSSPLNAREPWKARNG